MLAEAVLQVLRPATLGLMTLGLILGTVFGAVPGLTTVMGIALLLPITYYLQPMVAIPTLIAVYVGGISGGLISAILLGIPGTPASIVTTFDGYPMAKNGEAGKALATSIFASFVGGMASAVALSLIAPQLSRVVLAFGPFEYFALGVAGISIVASLSRGNTVKGLMAATLGIVFAMVGPDPVAGVPRFHFGMRRLSAGFSLIPALIGFFAVSQALADIGELKVSAPGAGDTTAARIGITNFRIPWKELASEWVNMLRSSIIGVGIGLLPGVGGPVAAFMSYDRAKRGSAHPEQFGKGALGGVVASETTNNAVTGGALSCLIVLGLPGDGATVALLGGLMIHGLRPGPLFMAEHPAVVYGIFAAFFLANILMFVTQYWGIRLYAQVLRVPTRVLIPLILTMCVIGAFALNRQVFDIWTLVLFGVIGYLFRKIGFPGAPFILAFILSALIEANLRRALTLARGNFLVVFEHPIAAGLLAVALLSVALSSFDLRIGRRVREKAE